MAKFLYIADTHLGANPMGYQQQKGYPERLPEILAALGEYALNEGGIDFILHGGDMIDSASDAMILDAAKAFKLPVPVYLCLGNHDLTAPDAVERWLKLAPDFFGDGKPDYTVFAGDCLIHVMPNHWGDRPFYWKDVQESHFSAAQIAWFARELDTMPELPHVVVTHSPVFGLPVEQTGLSEPYHCPNASFTASVLSLVAGRANVKCVLGAHNHLNMRVANAGVEFLTVSSLVETPFEFKLFGITPQRVTMSTSSLSPHLNFVGEDGQTKAFVQGRAVDRAFSCDC